MDRTNDSWIDVNLKLGIALVTMKQEREITKSFLMSLKELDLSNKNIKDIKGIEYCKNLEYLNLSKNNIKDISKLAKLTKLSNLILKENRIEDIRCIEKLKKLSILELDYNNICEIPNLKDNKYLIIINLSNNRIKDISCLYGLNFNTIQIIIKDQFILLNPILVQNNRSYVFHCPLNVDNKTLTLLDNIQVSGECDFTELDKRPSISYSISKIQLNNIESDCVIKSNFYYCHETTKDIIYTGIIIQPIISKNSNTRQQNDSTLNIEDKLSILYGNINIKEISSVQSNDLILKNKTITLIESGGNKIYSYIDEKGYYEFQDLYKGQYTLLYPYIYGYKYVTPSLYIVNIDNDQCLEINPTITKT